MLEDSPVAGLGEKISDELETNHIVFVWSVAEREGERDGLLERLCESRK